MTLMQEAHQKLESLPDYGIKLIIALEDELLRQTSERSEEVSPEDDAAKRYAAFQEVLAFREKHPFPKDYDWEKAREEAMRDKYGDISSFKSRRQNRTPGIAKGLFVCPDTIDDDNEMIAAWLEGEK